jgi:hypothetical protein
MSEVVSRQVLFSSSLTSRKHWFHRILSSVQTFDQLNHKTKCLHTDFYQPFVLKNQSLEHFQCLFTCWDWLHKGFDQSFACRKWLNERIKRINVNSDGWNVNSCVLNSPSIFIYVFGIFNWLQWINTYFTGSFMPVE